MLYDENNKVIMKSVNGLVGEPNLVCVRGERFASYVD